MRLSSTQARKMLFAAIPSICALSSKKISIYTEISMLLCFITSFVTFFKKRKTLFFLGFLSANGIEASSF